MANNILEEDVHQAVGQVMHPEISRTLVELGMVKDIAVKDDEVSLTLVLPLLGTVMKLGAKLEVRIAEMNQEERLAFLAMEQEGWKGS